MRFINKKEHATKVTNFIFNCNAGVFVNLQLRNYFTEVEPKVRDTLAFQITLNFIWVNMYSLNDFKYVVFLFGPIYLVSSYF